MLKQLARNTAFAFILVVLSVGANAQQDNLATMKMLNCEDGAPVIVMVPGFLNSLTTNKSFQNISPYFSNEVLKAVASRGSPVLAVDTLLPVANIEDNGDLLVKYLDTAVTKFPGRKLILIAHSSGGLYTLRALTKRPDLPVQTVVTIGTPYTGVEFLDNLRNDIPALEPIAKVLDLGSLVEFKKSVIAPLLTTFIVPQGIRWITIAGELPPCHFYNCETSTHLSWLLSLTQSLMTEPSDGIVTVSSALGNGVLLTDSNAQPFQFERWSDFSFPLEHWLMTKDGSRLEFLGIFHAAQTAALQTKLFGQILDRLEPEVSGPHAGPAPIVHSPPVPPTP